MLADAMRPPSITTAAWISPWREVPQPRYLPSFQVGAAGAVGGGGGGAGVTATGAGGGTTGVTAEGSGNSGAVAIADGGTDSAFVDIGPGTGSTRAMMAGFAGAAMGAGVTTKAATGTGAGATRTGRRSAVCSSNFCAADRVRAYPAAYTESTAAELTATRLFAIFLFDPRFDILNNGKTAGGLPRLRLHTFNPIVRLQNKHEQRYGTETTRPGSHR